jgi:AraC-like DNA-binding protein
MTQTDHFTYAASPRHKGLISLQAQMTEFEYGRHAHEEFAIGVTLQGVQEFTCASSMQRSIPGQIMLFSPEEIHDGHSGGDDALRYVMLYVNMSWLGNIFTAMGMRNGMQFRANTNVVESPALRQLILHVHDQLSRKEYDDIALNSSLYLLAENIRQYGDNRTDSRLTPAHRNVLLAREFMYEHAHEQLQLDEVCAIAQLSKFHFIRQFKKLYSITPHQYLINCRIQRAIVQLNSGSSLLDATYASGFFDLSHFIRYFKKSHGITPRQYQTSILNS